MSGTEAALGLVLVGAGQAGRRQEVLAQAGAVPLWFTPTDDPAEPHVAWVLGESEEWPSLVASALADGALAVMVDEPRPPNRASLAALEVTGRPILVMSRWSHAPVVRALVARLASMPERPTFVEMLLVDGVEREPSDALGGALLTLSAAGLAVDRVEHIVVGPTVVTAEARAGEVDVHVTVVRTPDAEARLKLAVFGPFGSVTARAAHPGVAAPGEVLLVTTEGALVLPSDYRTARRIALSEVRDAALRGSRPVLSVAGFAQAAHLALRATYDASLARHDGTRNANAKEHI